MEISFIARESIQQLLVSQRHTLTRAAEGPGGGNGHTACGSRIAKSNLQEP